MPTTAPDLARAARLFHALSDPTRLNILATLGGGERCVCDLQGDLDATQSRLSFHLRVLKDAGLVTDRKDGRWSYYTLLPEALAEVRDVVDALAPGVVAFADAGGGCGRRTPERNRPPAAQRAAQRCCG